MFKNPIVKNILSALAVAGFGFVLLGLTFLFDFLFQSLIVGFIKLFIPVSVNPEMDYYWFPQMMHALFVILMAVVSWFIFRTKWPVLIKAIYLPVPVAVVLVTVGIFTYQIPYLSYTLGTILTLVTLFYFWRTKQPWLYYIGIIYVAICLLIMGMTGAEI